MKMVLVVTGTAAAVLFQRAVRHQEPSSIRMQAVVTLLIWLGIVVLGRLIAYDHVWGSWSAALKG